MIHRSLSKETPIIAVRQFTAGYDGHVLLRDLSFDIYPGEVFVILGGSGSGKSTLLKHMIGLYRPVTGSIRIEDKDIVTAQGEERLKILARIGVMYQQGALFGSMTLLENVRLPLEEYTDLPNEAIDRIALMADLKTKLSPSQQPQLDRMYQGLERRWQNSRAYLDAQKRTLGLP